MDISKTHYNYLLQVRETRQSDSSIERDNLSAKYLSNGDSLNNKFCLYVFSIKNEENNT